MAQLTLPPLPLRPSVACLNVIWFQQGDAAYANATVAISQKADIVREQANAACNASLMSTGECHETCQWGPYEVRVLKFRCSERNNGSGVSPTS